MRNLPDFSTTSSGNQPKKCCQSCFGYSCLLTRSKERDARLTFYGVSVWVIVLEALPEDQEILVAWNGLVFRIERPTVFFTRQCGLAASRPFSVSLSPRILLMYEAGHLAGIAAMATTLKSPVTFLTASTANYCDIVSAPETRCAIVKLPSIPQKHGLTPVSSRRDKGTHIGGVWWRGFRASIEPPGESFSIGFLTSFACHQNGERW
jgi:hypothetical protein